MRPAILIDEAKLLEVGEYRGKMRGGFGPLGAFEPVLIEERGEGRLAELDFPEDTEERCPRFLGLARHTEEKLRRIRRFAVAGFGARAETEIDRVPAFGRCELEMRDLMQQHIGLGLAAKRAAAPAKIQQRATGKDRHAEKLSQRDGDLLMRLGRVGAGALGLARIGDAPEDGTRRQRKMVRKTVEHGFQRVRFDRCQDHAEKRIESVVGEGSDAADLGSETGAGKVSARLARSAMGLYRSAVLSGVQTWRAPAATMAGEMAEFSREMGLGAQCP